MPYQIKVNLPGTARDEDVQVPGLGTYKNGRPHTVSDDEAVAFRTFQRDNGMPDRTILEAFKGSEFVQVTEVKEEQPKPGGNNGDKDGGE